MTNYECGRALVYIAEVIIKTFGKEFGYDVQEPKQEPKEPLIKDEKIRKAVRAWAEANDMSSDSVVICGSFDDGFETDTSSIEFDCTIRDALRGLKRGKSYTIAELCGEEEE